MRKLLQKTRNEPMKSTSRILLEWKLIPLLKNINGWDIIDIGSKDARYKKHIQHTSYTSLDIEPNFKTDITADIQEYETNTRYDTALCTQVLEHIPNPQKAITQIYKLLKPGGRMILTTPFIFPIHSNSDYYRFSPQALQELLKDFKIITIIPVGNFISSSWTIFNFHNKLGLQLLNYPIALLSLIFNNKYCPETYITIARK